MQTSVIALQEAIGVKIEGSLKGFNKTDNVTKHGFRIHAKGMLTNQCRDAGGLFNPSNTEP